MKAKRESYDVFENPIPRARRAFPFVTILQSEIADTGRDRIVAPLVARTRMPAVSGRLTPIVKVLGAEYVLLVPRMLRSLSQTCARQKTSSVHTETRL